jgi:hypothetical protein
VNRVRSLLEEIGLGGERVRMVNLSAAMGARFAEIAAEMVEKIRALGPNPVDGTRPAPVVKQMRAAKASPSAVCNSPSTDYGGER